MNYLEKKKLILVDNFYNEYDEEANERTIGFQLNSYSSTNITENIIHEKELSKILNSEIEMLSPIYRTLITLYHNEELSYEEISTITQLPRRNGKKLFIQGKKNVERKFIKQIRKRRIMITKHLSDFDIQQWVLDKSNCDANIIEHIQECEHCKMKVETYQLLFSEIKEQPKPAFDFNLSEIILPQISPAQPTSQSN